MPANMVSQDTTLEPVRVDQATKWPAMFISETNVYVTLAWHALQCIRLTGSGGDIALIGARI